MQVIVQVVYPNAKEEHVTVTDLPEDHLIRASESSLGQIVGVSMYCLSCHFRMPANKLLWTLD